MEFSPKVAASPSCDSRSEESILVSQNVSFIGSPDREARLDGR